ncbi:hypothetical protein [Xenorhabdus bovienii]|uniref:hypothetical protein n=1 Tax=Xenorhabdus bovienii TaxID=40576 RepID=UPI00068CAD1A|nr:hypothetical protein [Xenorhabdus bovienii]
MKPHDSYHNSIYTLSGAFHLVVAIVIAILGTWLSSKVISESVTSFPWGVVTILLLPTGYCINLLIKLSETKKNIIEDLTRSEGRSLTLIINRKIYNSIIILAFQFIIAGIIVILSVGSIPDFLDGYQRNIVGLVIGLTISSLYLVIPSIFGIKEVNDFEALIKYRKAQAKKIKTALNKLK